METKKRGRIENLKPWKPGQSGNPGGRPKRDVAAEIARAVFEGNEEAIYRALCKALLKGNPRLFVALADRAYGRLTKAVEVSGLEGLAERIAAARKRIVENNGQNSLNHDAGPAPENRSKNRQSAVPYSVPLHHRKP